ncbi:hypothetical protein H4217_000146 [Coemansia sp. RSA 1939]|nr:hypothetical protein H4217_000146 [Coemansia sp. RSA 1939]
MERQYCDLHTREVCEDFEEDYMVLIYHDTDYLEIKRKRHDDTNININVDDVLTSKDGDTGRNPPPKQSPEGPPHPVSEQKRPKLVSYSESASESENDSDSESNNKGENVDIPESAVPMDASTGLPTGFFDADAPVYTDGVSDDEGDSGVIGDLKPTVTLPAQSSSANNNNNERLLQSLDDFESEIAGLADEVDKSADLSEPSGQEKNTPKDDVDAQGELWRARAAQLKHLRSIVKDGMQAMDPMEATHEEMSPSRMDVSSGGSNIADSDQLSETSGDEGEDGDDFTFLTGWRMV